MFPKVPDYLFLNPLVALVSPILWPSLQTNFLHGLCIVFFSAMLINTRGIRALTLLPFVSILFVMLGFIRMIFCFKNLYKELLVSLSHLLLIFNNFVFLCLPSPSPLFSPLLSSSDLSSVSGPPASTASVLSSFGQPSSALSLSPGLIPWSLRSSHAADPSPLVVHASSLASPPYLSWPSPGSQPMVSPIPQSSFTTSPLSPV